MAIKALSKIQQKRVSEANEFLITMGAKGVNVRKIHTFSALGGYSHFPGNVL